MTKAKAVDKLQPSRLQTEGLGDNVDLSQLNLARKGEASLNIADQILSGEIVRTIEGASFVSLTVSDANKKIYRSGKLSDKVDIKIDGLWFRLVGHSKQGPELTLTFEDREVAILRTYTKKLQRSRAHVTRAQFVKLMVDEVKEFDLRFVCPELKQRQPLEKSTDKQDRWQQDEDREFGFPSDMGKYESPAVRGEAAKTHAGRVTVKGRDADKHQLRVIDDVLQTGVSMGARIKVLLTALMTITQESSARNLQHGDRDSMGAFQQRRKYFPNSGKDVVADAKIFFKACIEEDKQDPNLEEWELAQEVQRSSNGRLYAQWKQESMHTLEVWGAISDEDLPSVIGAADWRENAGGSEFLFTRGKPNTNLPDGWENEDSWSAMQRLATEVNWRSFAVSGTIYFISEKRLFKSRIRHRITEDVDGINWIDHDLDVGKKSRSRSIREATVTVDCRLTRWGCPPGTVIWIAEKGPVEGRWLVKEVRRDIFSPDGEMKLVKPRPKLPEPLDDGIEDPGAGGFKKGQKTGAIVLPLSVNYTENSEFDVVDPEGAPSSDGKRYHAAKDWFAPPSTPIFAPFKSEVKEIKPSIRDFGQVFGGVVKLQEDGINNYIWVFRHIVPDERISVGDHIKAGTMIARVIRWRDAPGSSHTHIEIWKTLSGGYVKENMVDPIEYIKSFIDS